MARRKATVYKRVRVDHVEKKGGGNLFVYLSIVVVVPAFMLGLLYVKLTSDQVKMKRDLSQVRREFALRSKELANLRVEEEMYSDGNRILAHVRDMGLDLNAPRRGQVIRVRNGRPVPGGLPASERVVAGR